MKKFRFQLQTVHDLRETAREEAERRLAEATARVDEAEASLREAGRMIATAADTYAARVQSGPFDAHEAALNADYVSALCRRQREARAQLAEREQEREARRRSVVEAAQAAQVTAKLRERELTRHRHEAARHEQNLLDEIATAASARRLRKA